MNVIEPYWRSDCGRYTLYHGDCRDVMASMDAESVDAVVTDGPYGLGFMGRDWDHGVPGKHFWELALRLAKPGAHLLAFGGTRTYHRLVCAIEDAGWEVRNMIGWVYGSGFNKVGYIKDGNGEIVKPGWGGSLKPAIEPICLARKPLDGTVAANVLKHGCGGLNIDGCRIPTRDFDGMTAETFSGVKSGVGSWNRADKGIFDAGRRGGYLNGPPSGRWPANLILSYPADEYELRSDVTPEQKRELYGWLSANA